MMPEISLNILDVVQNSVRAGASLIELTVAALSAEDTLTVTIRDNGCGMTEEQTKRVIDPFFTTRTTRRIGLGIPFFKQAAESTGGFLGIESKPDIGTTVTAVFGLSHIDRMPLGDMTSTVHMLITMNPDLDFVYRFSVDERSFTLDTREFRMILGEVSFTSPEISVYIKEFLEENKKDVISGFIV